MRLRLVYQLKDGGSLMHPLSLLASPLPPPALSAIVKTQPVKQHLLSLLFPILRILLLPLLGLKRLLTPLPRFVLSLCRPRPRLATLDHPHDAREARRRRR